MVKKYERQYQQLGFEIKSGLKNKENKAIIIHKLRRQKIILHYIENCRKKINVLVEKQYALEQLNITKLQLEALQNSVKVFKSFTKSHSIEKIETLQETLEDLTTQFLDVESCLQESSPLVMDFDDVELEKELEMMEQNELEFPEVPLQEIDLSDQEKTQTTALLA